MAGNTHKGTELNNVKETWDQNERNSGANAGSSDASGRDTENSNDLERAVKEEAAEYDNSNKADRVLGGERATLNDDESDSDLGTK